MPLDSVYGIKITDDLTGQFEYSPPFRLSIPKSTFGKPAASSLTPGASSKPSEISPSPSLSSLPPSTASSFRASPPPSSFSTPSSPSAGVAAGDGRLDKAQPMKLETILGLLGAGVGAVTLGAVIFAVWRRIRGDQRKLANVPPGRSFRDTWRRSLGEGYSPIAESVAADAVHRRILSTSSFGDGARASALFERAGFDPPKPIPLSPITDGSPPPTPFAAPALTFPPVAARRASQPCASRGFAAPPHFPPSPPPRPGRDGPANACAPRPATVAPDAGENTRTSSATPYRPAGEPPAGFAPAAAPGRCNFSWPVPRYTTFSPNMPPTRPASAATTAAGTESTYRSYQPP